MSLATAFQQVHGRVSPLGEDSFLGCLALFHRQDSAIIDFPLLLGVAESFVDENEDSDVLIAVLQTADFDNEDVLLAISAEIEEFLTLSDEALAQAIMSTTTGTDHHLTGDDIFHVPDTLLTVKKYINQRLQYLHQKRPLKLTNQS